ncbi:Bicoid-interacting protein 3-domain-containing protein [Phascolomyces articulosus]|uniref:RNA methyltransferase n=1 Tax=Phascolomyces articulosus TaxID=60185 RepID=A0AAD5KAV5_9FUNG|nr:Bicoid-interacting protein 3-domain-containing protein [Phascolomyces articulosus]
MLGAKADSVMTKKPKFQEEKTIQDHYAFGNYRNYYEARRGNQTTDKRLDLLPGELFHDKHVLDIGCNSGNITIMIGLQHHPSHILGIDLDDSLIKQAEKQLRLVNSLSNPKGNNSTDLQMRFHHFPRALTNLHGWVPITMPPGYQSTVFPHNVSFETKNWMDINLKGQENKYDTVLALSITKWIHIHHGDKGMKDFFKRIYQVLKPGGILILEPQVYETYERRAKKNDTMKSIFDQIQFLPDQFHDYLMQQVGFKEFKDLESKETTAKRGFNRPLHLYVK